MVDIVDLNFMLCVTLFYLMSYIDQNIQDIGKDQTILLPEAKFTTNRAQLDYLQKRVLANYYDKQIRQKNQDQTTSRRQNSLNTPRTTSQNPQSSQSRLTTNSPLSFFQMNQLERDRERIMRIQLAQQYQREMERKQLMKKMQKQRKKRDDEANLQSLKKLGQLENEKLKRDYEISRNNMNEQITMAQRHRRESVQNKLKERQAFNERYGNIPRSNSLGSAQYSQKLAQFRRHYDNINNIQKQIQNNYIQKWSPIIQKKENEKNKLIQAGISKNTQLQNQKYIQKSQQQQKLYKNLKSSLINQILEKQRLKNQALQEEKKQHYTTKNYQGIFHPICNPIDLKLTRDNKYILRELKQEQEIQDRSTQSSKSNNLTGLARNGSYVLLSK